MATVYRADTIGSLLRPQYPKLAREQSEAGQLEPAAYKEIEDRAVDQVIASASPGSGPASRSTGSSARARTC
jgi:methionine synthase II (cobalamin-independent)